jgi:hypothetical protein
MPPGYKYLFRSPLGTISHSFTVSFSCLRFLPLVLYFPIMEDKRGIKQERFLSTEGSPEPSDAKTPPPTPSGSPSPPGSPSKVASRHPRSPVFEQGGPSEKALVIFEFAQRLYGELNRGFLGPPGDSKIIILNDSDVEKEEVREEKSSSLEDVAASTAVNPASTSSANDADAPTKKSLTPATSPANATEDPEVAPNDSSDGLAPNLKMEEGSSGGDEAGVS